MKILGIDPGMAILGWSVLEVEARTPKKVHYGCIRTPPHQTLSHRLQQIYNDLTQLVGKHRPDVMVLETLFFVKNAKTLAQVGHCRGVILLVASQHQMEICEYAPRQIKLALSGYGGADKRQMQLTVQRMLNLPHIPKPDDAADAVAVALCHLQYRHSFERSAVTV